MSISELEQARKIADAKELNLGRFDKELINFVLPPAKETLIPSKHDAFKSQAMVQIRDEILERKLKIYPGDHLN